MSLRTSLGCRKQSTSADSKRRLPCSRQTLVRLRRLSRSAARPRPSWSSWVTARSGSVDLTRHGLRSRAPSTRSNSSPDFAFLAPGALDFHSYLALAYAGLGEKEKALEEARRAVAEYDTDAVVKPQAEGALAQIQARFGDFDSAIAVLPHLLEVPAGITVADLLQPIWPGSAAKKIHGSRNSLLSSRQGKWVNGAILQR